MSEQSIEINPLNVLGKRVVKSLPAHFTTINVPCDSWRISERIKELKYWIFTTLEGRYWVGDSSSEFSFDGNNMITVEFEDSAEATYFSLAYPENEQEETPF